MLKSWLQKWVGADFIRCSLRCNDWSGQAVAALHPRTLLDVGCGDGSLLLRYLEKKPERFCGIEAAPALRAKAEQRGLEVTSCDLNGVWPYEDETFDVVHCAQVIEHLHNTRLFIQEMFRVLKPGGTALVTSENLTSFLNLGAMALGYTPFTLMRVCGWFTGNPLGLHYGEETEEHVPITDPSFAGVTGHIRALSVLQAKELFERVGFETESCSLGLLPIPDVLGRHLERGMPRRGHFLLVRARKPAPVTKAPSRTKPNVEAGVHHAEAAAPIPSTDIPQTGSTTPSPPRQPSRKTAARAVKPAKTTTRTTSSQARTKQAAAKGTTSRKKAVRSKKSARSRSE